MNQLSRVPSRLATTATLLLLAAVTSTATLIPGCKVGPDYQTPQASTKEDQYTALSGEDAEKASPDVKPSADRPLQPGELAQWWNVFEDPLLNSLVQRAIIQNQDLKLATARVREARALRGIDAADLYPQANAGAAASRSRQSENIAGQPGVGTKEENFFEVGLDASWEIDVFGGIRRAVEAADADIVAAEEARNGTLISLVAEVARNYTELRSFQRRVEVNVSSIRAQQETLDLTQSLARAGISAELQVEQSKAQLAARESQLPPLRVGVRAACYRLAVLLGQEPAALLPELATAGAIPHPPQEVPVGLPSQLLRRRPDIRRAERNIAAATARIGVATADLFPKFSLTGSFGFQSEETDKLFDMNSRFWSFGPAVRWNIFSAGKVQNRIKAASAREEQALAIYEQTVLLSLEEVENSLTSFIQEQARLRSLVAAEQASRRALDLATERYKSGIGDFLNVLDAQRAVYELQDQLVDSEAQVTRSVISVYKALGGGWESPAGKPQEPPKTPDAPAARAMPETSPPPPEAAPRSGPHGGALPGRP